MVPSDCSRSKKAQVVDNAALAVQFGAREVVVNTEAGRELAGHDAGAAGGADPGVKK